MSRLCDARLEIVIVYPDRWPVVSNPNVNSKAVLNGFLKQSAEVQPKSEDNAGQAGRRRPLGNGMLFRTRAVHRKSP
jgi:hypothetical protein